MGKQLKKNLIIILVIALVIACLACAFGYLITYFFQLPVSLPFMSYALADNSLPAETVAIMDSWRDYETYQRHTKYTTVEEILEDTNIDIEEISVDQLIDMFPLIEPESLTAWINANPEAIIDGYERLFMDQANYETTYTGIKTIYGDDVVALDAINGIMIVGIDVPFGTNTSCVKLAVFSNKQLDMTIVDDLRYWDMIDLHSSKNGAILAINASGYNWNDTGNYATLYGAARWHGTTYRKAAVVENVVCFSTDGTMTIGSNVEDAYNAVEMTPILIKDGQIVLDESSNEAKSRHAQTAIGQAINGTTFMLVASGGMYGSNLGANANELADILLEYGAVNASCLSGGSRSVMYWNGRVINQTVGYDQTGVKLPDTLCVYPKYLLESED